MKKRLIRVMALIVLGVLLVALPIEIIGLVRNQRAFEAEAEDKIEYAMKSAANDLNVIFSNMENLVNMLRASVQVTFSSQDYIRDESIFRRLKKQTGDIIKRTLEKTEHLSGLYVTFSPDLHSGMEEVWYAYQNGNVIPIDARQFAPSWLVKGNPRVNYYYDAIQQGSYWGALDYESSLDAFMTTHTKSVYDDQGNLIGIVGSDMLMSEVDETLRSIKLYSDSQVMLFDAEMNYYASSETEEDPKKEYAPLISAFSNADWDGAPIWYDPGDGKKRVAAYATLNNGWILAATQTAATVMTSATETRRTLIVTTLLTVLSIIAVVMALIKRYYGPVIKSAEQNEILLIHQSRQAKLGEMIGNIAHQCKQPLNNISIDISNMKDDYRAGELTLEGFQEYEDKMRENVSVMSSTITDFADFLKPDRKKESFSIRDSVEKALSILRENLVLNEIAVTNQVDEALFLTNYRNEFIQCVFNIIENARDGAMASGIRPRVIDIRSERRDENKYKVILLRIFNSGTAISEQHLDKIFLPYYSTKEEKGGTGIGLYLAKQIIEDHFHGEITCANQETGVRFTIKLKERK
ncbi:MAG: sensor histidine kinase [Firmicutes bacterium]|jgi:signal transduction histidine kinase|nr:sensor histidine kinase [Bacillota bacterium]